MLEWLAVQGCQIDGSSSVAAARGGQLGMMECAVANDGVPRRQDLVPCPVPGGMVVWH